MHGYTTAEVAGLLGLPVSQVRSFVRSGFLKPMAGPRGRLLFSFQDLVLLRTAKGLVDAKIPQRRVKHALKRLKEQLPDDRPLTGVAISADGKRVVVRDGNGRYDPEDGQALFDFEVEEIARKVAPLLQKTAEKAKRDEGNHSADDWFHLGCDLELTHVAEARDAYRRAIEIDPLHADAHVNLGRLLHEEGTLDSAEAHYKLALKARTDDSIAAFNLGVVLEDLGRIDEAIDAYERCIKIDQRSADAHFNVARLYEQTGRPMLALRHLKAYRKLGPHGA